MAKNYPAAVIEMNRKSICSSLVLLACVFPLFADQQQVLTESNMASPEPAAPAVEKVAPVTEKQATVTAAQAPTAAKTADGKTESAQLALKPDETELQLTRFGTITAWNMGLCHFLTAKDYQYFEKGLRGAIVERQMPPKLTEKEQAALQEFISKRETEQIENNRKVGETFRKTKEKEAGFKKLPSGVVVNVIKAGDSVRATDDCTVEIDYEGKLISGEVFDSTFERKEHATLYLGMIISGLREVIQQIGNGGEARAFIPPENAYGDESMGIIPGGSTLEFWIKIHKITNPVVDLKPEPAKPAATPVKAAPAPTPAPVPVSPVDSRAR
ncbi:MAG: FKBP-type peptidyl-prolyl cis-trans isomerase [Verrucomicrobiota bacterium]|nr:MAG: FKBP-type peptidyl-prolyl cis-trans isomerase [Verrucomicrobiota bacterium]